MPTFGHTAQGLVKAGVMAGDTKFALRTSAQETGTVTEVAVDMQNDGAEIQAFRAGIYADAATVSNSALIDQSDTVLLSPGTPRSWVRFSSGINASVTAGQILWLVLHAGLAGGNASFWYDSGVGREQIAADTYSDGLSAAFGTVSVDQANTIAIYATYTTVPQSRKGLSRVPALAGWK